MHGATQGFYEVLDKSVFLATYILVEETFQAAVTCIFF